MSLCPNFCECRGCKHGYKTCQWCVECHEAHVRRKEQERHEESVNKQKSKIRRIAKD